MPYDPKDGPETQIMIAASIAPNPIVNRAMDHTPS